MENTNTIVLPMWKDINVKSEEVQRLVERITAELLRKAPLGVGIEVEIKLGPTRGNKAIIQQAQALVIMFNDTQDWKAKARQDTSNDDHDMFLCLTPQ